MGSFGISEGNITRRRKVEEENTHTHTHTHTEYAPNGCQQRSSPDAQAHHQRAGAGQGGMGYIIGAYGKDQA